MERKALMRSEAAISNPLDELEQRVRARTAELQSANDMLRQSKQALTQEIGKYKSSDAALRESQEIIAAILDAVPARIFWKDMNLVYLGCNAPFAREAGFARPEDIIGKDDYQMGWLKQADKYRADDREVIVGGRSKLLIDEPQTTPDGNVITLLTSKIPLRDPNGEVFGVLGTYLDVTERARLEEQLATRTLQFDAALNNMAQGLLMFDRDHKVAISNRRFAELFNLPWEKWRVAALGKTLQEVIQLIHEWTNETAINYEQIIAEVRGWSSETKANRSYMSGPMEELSVP